MVVLERQSAFALLDIREVMALLKRGPLVDAEPRVPSRSQNRLLLRIALEDSSLRLAVGREERKTRVLRECPDHALRELTLEYLEVRVDHRQIIGLQTDQLSRPDLTTALVVALPELLLPGVGHVPIARLDTVARGPE